MSSGLMVVTLNKEPCIGESINLNADNEEDNSYINFSLQSKSQIIFPNKEIAVDNLPQEDHEIGCVAFVSDPLKVTSKMKKIHDKLTELETNKSALKIKWKENSLNVNQKTCYNCKSKIVQSHNKTKNSSLKSVPCPSCKATDYLLTKSDRTKIENCDIKFKKLISDLRDLEEIDFQKRLKSKNLKLKYVVGGWVHQSDLPINY